MGDLQKQQKNKTEINNKRTWNLTCKRLDRSLTGLLTDDVTTYFQIESFWNKSEILFRFKTESVGQ